MASKNGKNYRAANGTVIKNYGQRIITGQNESGHNVSLPIQVADVNKVLGSAREMIGAGNKIVLERDQHGKNVSYMEHKPTGQITTINEVNGTFQFKIIIPKGEGNCVQEVKEEVQDQGFPRQGTLEADLFY